MLEWLKVLREKAGFTQGKLAERVKVERSLISKIETGSARPSPDTAKAIAKVLGFEWTKFFDSNEESA